MDELNQDKKDSELREVTERMNVCENTLQSMTESIDESLKQIKMTLDSISKPKGETSSGWIEVSDDERIKAGDLRIALLLGKVPATAGLLIDKKVMSELLNVSSRTLSRLDDLQAIPEPIRLGGSMIRWRLAELLAWMDAGCPLRRNWTYPTSIEPKKRR